MNPVILNFADGTTFFLGLVLVLMAEGMLFCIRNRIARPILTILAIVGIMLVISSATPLPIWLYAIWTVPAIAGLVLSSFAALPRRHCVLYGSVLLLATLALGLAEVPHRRRPCLAIHEGTTIYVLGDSISAGIGTNHRSWPAVLDELTPLRVVNLAQPGATVESAITQAKGIAEQHSIVIVEIGGNDLLGGTDVSVFRTKLDTLVSSLRADQHEVLLFELPLFPFQNAYGKAQREIVGEHGISMLPKRFFVKVLGTEDGTLDGLHLSQAGHDAMARIVAGVISQE